MSVYMAERLAADRGAVYPADEVRWIWEPVQEAVRRSGLGADAVVEHPLTLDDAPLPSERLTFERLAEDEPSGVRNQMTQHPPAYYVLTGSAVQLFRQVGSVSFDLQVALLRTLGILLLAPLPLLSAVAARRLGADEHGAVLAALIPVGVPMLFHIGAAVNNDVLLIALAAALTPLLLDVVSGERRLSRTWAVGALGGGALLAKGFGLVVPAWIALAVGLGFWRTRHLAVAVHGAVGLMLAVAFGGWWWLRNILLSGEIQPHHHPLPVAAPEFAPDWWWWSGFAALRFIRRFWIEPDILAAGAIRWELFATLGLIALVALGAATAVRRNGLPEALVLLFPFFSIAALVAYGAVDLYQETGAPFGIHGRYTYPGLVGLAALVGLSPQALRPAKRWLPMLMVGGGALLLQAWAWWSAVDHYWAAAGSSTLDSVRTMLAWSPLPRWVVLFAVLAHWSLFLLALAVAVRAGLRQPPGVRAVSTNLG